MGEKTRSNYALGQKLTDEQWERLFRKKPCKSHCVECEELDIDTLNCPYETNGHKDRE